MSLNNFDGDTFVAFIDISGFSKMMIESDEKAINALNLFYQVGFDTIKKFRSESKFIDGLFISDSGIIYYNKSKEKLYQNLTNVDRLLILLSSLEEIHKSMLLKRYLINSSVSYGYVRFTKKIETSGISKNPIYGKAYVSAYRDNESGHPKINPGECRILIDSLPKDIKNFLENENENIFKINRISKKANDKNHLYFYWMLDDLELSVEFDTKYKRIYESRYDSIIDLLDEKWGDLRSINIK